ncbi:MAG: hypothetical protein U0414_11375 [Polyangiaceae bacterium]
MTQRAPILNEEQAMLEIDSIKSPAMRTLLRMAVAQARLEMIRGSDQSESEWKSSLPGAPFDLRFFVRVLRKAFRSEHVVAAILEGKSVAEATGWAEWDEGTNM